ncbi:hypothetical protein [Piscibacillus halophilus]|uniref:Lipoprotein n=1 Tax=Piscibacillus halophilus TaxID=571933 RepID=A0A1H9H0E6_9BACI|nr:hypothetical protein [Piscibacillus halophilus]SEQ55790.1 hypothetical protein SAMN05216362_11739 [Piscibacillus halophilus]
MKYLSVSLVVVILILSACSNDEEVVTFENKDFANTLIVQKVENSSSSSDKKKTVTDKEKIEKVLSKVEGLKVKKISVEDSMDQLQGQEVYTFGFFKDPESAENGEYAFNVLEDGKILINYDDVANPNTPLITLDTH